MTRPFVVERDEVRTAYARAVVVTIEI